MVKGDLALFFDDGEKFNAFHEMIEVMQKAGILPEDFGWSWEQVENDFVVSIFSKETSLQKKGKTDDP